MTTTQLKSVSNDLPHILIQMKFDRVKLNEDIFWHEYGKLSIGGSYCRPCIQYIYTYKGRKVGIKLPNRQQ